MLPPSKKRANLEDAVTTVAKGGSVRPAPRSERPEPVPAFAVTADSVTRLMPAKSASDMPPPPSSKPASRPASVRPNVSFRPSTEVTMLRPLAAPAAGTPASLSDADRVKAQIKAVRAARAAEKAVRAGESDPRIDPPASTVTAGIVIKARPTASWAMALVAMGLFGGLLTAVVARGDGDAIVAAGAAFVDPGQAAQITAAHELQRFQPAVAVDQPTTQAPSVMQTSDVIPTVVVAAVTDTKVAVKPAQVAVAKPVAPKASPAPAAPAEKPIAAMTPKPAAAAPPAAPKPAAKPKASAANDDMASAAAADALAKAQLESSLK